MDLTTKYMGLELKNPLVPSASPLSQKVDDIKKLAEAGASAIVMFSIFEEQIQHDADALEHLLSAGAESYSEALGYFPAIDNYTVGVERYTDLLSEAVNAVDIPIIGSLNGLSSEGWIDYAKKMEQTGIKGLELNIYYIPTSLDMTSAHVETMYLDVVKAVKATVSIPVAIKLNPFCSATANMARQMTEAGADALVLFNRFYQPEFNLDTMSVETDINLSTPEEMRLPLRWIAILYDRINASLAGTTGVHSGRDMAKYLLAGADVAMTTSALLKNGIGHIKTMLDELQSWMEEKEYQSVSQMKGAMSQKAVENPAAFERANYIKALEDYKAKYII